MNINILTEIHEENGVSVILEWNVDAIYFYNVIVVPEANFTDVTNGVGQLSVFYNTRYNVSIVATHRYELYSMTSSIALHYGKLVVGLQYTDKALWVQ